MKLNRYLNEKESVKDIKKELKELKKSSNLTALGKKRMAYLEGELIKQGIFDF